MSGLLHRCKQSDFIQGVLPVPLVKAVEFDLQSIAVEFIQIFLSATISLLTLLRAYMLPSVVLLTRYTVPKDPSPKK